MKLLFSKALWLFSVPLAVLAVPPREIPPSLLSRYTLENRIPVALSYRDDTRSSDSPSFYSEEEIDACIQKVKAGELGYYGNTDIWLYKALTLFPLKDKSVAIIGSTTPWYESIVLAFGGKPVTIEYNKIITDDPRLKILTVEEYEKEPLQFDVILSISSTEHDGLGRYGDPLNPEADLQFMTKVRTQMLKPEGLLFLAVPIGMDCLIWNECRIYGPLRFPLLVEGWNAVGSFGFREDNFLLPLTFYGHQPLFVLEPASSKKWKNFFLSLDL